VVKRAQKAPICVLETTPLRVCRSVTMRALSEPPGDRASAALRVVPGNPTCREAAVRALYEAQHAQLVRFATFIMGDAHAAEDVAQEAFMRVYDAWDRLEDQGRAVAYLRATIVNLSRGRHRRRLVAERKQPPHLVAVQSAEDDAMGHVGHGAVLAAVSALPSRQRACVVMRHWLRMTEGEIAATLDVSIGSVRTHNKRGLATLQRTLGDLR
jgi:RNA polymerase sigma-70 factor (sigma-E family)